MKRIALDLTTNDGQYSELEINHKELSFMDNNDFLVAEYSISSPECLSAIEDFKRDLREAVDRLLARSKKDLVSHHHGFAA